VQQGLLKQDAEFGSLTLTAQAIPVLKGEVQFWGNLLETAPPRLRHTTPSKGEGPGEGSAELFEILRKKRKEIADEHNLAPYMIFSDKSLVDMCAQLPQNREAFLEVHGVGEVKWLRYGEQFLYLIREFADQQT
jgi:ATP-dependent DNA helicase RecQ